MRRVPPPIAALGLLAVGGVTWLALAPRTGVPAGPGHVESPARSPESAPQTGGVLGLSPRGPRTARVRSGPEGTAESNRFLLRVQDASGAPLAGARVVARIGDVLRESPTDPAGTVAFESLPEGADVLLDVTAEGFVGTTLRLQVRTGEDAERSRDVTLSRGVPFDGHVVDDRDGTPLAGVEIRLEQGGPSFGDRGVYAGTRTGADGRFHVGGIPPGQRTHAVVKMHGYAPRVEEVRAFSDSVLPDPVEIRLVPCGRASGTVRDPSGALVGGAHVFAVPSDAAEQTLDERTDDLGHYEIEGLKFGVDYAVHAEALEWLDSEPRAGLRAEEDRRELRADLSLRVGGTVVVRVLDAGGKPVTEAVQVMAEGNYGRETDPSGECVFRGLAAGPLELTLSSEAFVTAKATVDVEADRTKEVSVRLDRGATVEGLVVDDGGSPIHLAHVWVSPAGGDFHQNLRSTQTGDDGRFRLLGLPPGNLNISAYGETGWREAGPIAIVAPARDVRLVLVRLRSARGLLLLPDGTKYEGRVSTHLRRGGSTWTRGMLVGEGRLVVEGLEDGEYELSVTAEGNYGPVLRKFASRRTGDTDLGEMRLEPGIDLNGRVLDPTGIPVALARVRLRDTPLPETETDARGRFSLGGCPRGDAKIDVTADGFLEAAVAVLVERGAASVEVRLSRGALVRGSLQEADGTGAAGVEIRAYALGPDGKRAPDAPPTVSAVGRDGRLEMRLPPGRYTFVAHDEHIETPLGEWTFVEGETRDVDLVLPRR